MRKVVKQRFIKTGLVVLMFVAIFCLTFTLNRLYIRSNTDMVSVAVASTKIPAYSVISSEKVTTKLMPRSAVPKEAVLDPHSYFHGKTVYAGDLGFGQGDIIRTDRITEGNTAPVGNLAQLQERNKMLLSIDTNLVKSCANLVVPGTLVNAVVFIKGQDYNAVDKVISPAEDPRLGNLLVVAKKNSESATPPEQGREAIPAVITLQLDQTNLDVAKALVEYNEKGSIYLLPIGFKSEVYLAAGVSK